ncbi:MAG: biosynthetic-type acetolactate synthase large subunit [Culicoidibacterales bacterium]
MNNKEMTGARAVLEALRRLEVAYIFGYPGGSIIPIYNELYDFEGVEHIFVRHEQGASHAADGYARVSGKIGVCLATSGPGATNLVTGIMTAKMDSIPLLAITGQVTSKLLGKDAFQETDIVGITMPITKHSFLIKDIKEIPELIHVAYQIAMSGRKGPVLVDIPKDIQMQTISQADFEVAFAQGVLEKPKYDSTYIVGNEGELKQLLAAAKRPIIIAGAGVVCSNCAAELYDFTRHFDIPVVSTLLGLGAIPLADDYALGMIGMHGSIYGNYALRDADLVIALGMRFDDRVTGNPETFIPNAKIIHIDIDRAEINKNKPVDVGIVTSAKKGLALLQQAATKTKHLNWLEQINAWKHEFPLVPTKSAEGLTAGQVVDYISNITDGKAIVVTDVGQHQMWVAQHYKFTTPRFFASSGGAGTMGYGIPAALGAQFAAPNELVIAFVGDGGFQMTCQELMTIHAEKLPVKIVIINNGFLGMVRQWQELFHTKRYSSVDLAVNPNFEMLAQSYGLDAVTISTEADYPLLKEAITNDRATVINIHVAKEENVFPMIPAGLGVDQIVHGGEENE